jgi:C-terminal processing protease CtpA/Prc
MRILTPSLIFATMSIAVMAQQVQTLSDGFYQQETHKAYELYEKHAYAEAATVLTRLATDPQIFRFQDWPERLYDLACDQALAGQSAQALDTLKRTFDLGSGPYFSSRHLASDPDLASLQSDPQFQHLLARVVKDESLWTDNPAIATPYKRVLSDEEKIAGLSKIWSEARYNFPFFQRAPSLDWDRQFMEYLAQIKSTQTTAEYYRLLMRFVATLQDGHTEVWPPNEIRDELFSTPPLRTQLVEDEVLVTEVYDPSLQAQGLNVGVQIDAIDGLPVKDYAARFVMPYASGSTVQDRMNRTFGYMLLRGDKAKSIALTIRDAKGTTKSTIIHRYFEASSQCTWPEQKKTDLKMLEGNVAYLAVNEFVDNAGAKAMREHFQSIAASDGLIIDLRCNNGGNQFNATAILAMLTNHSVPNVSFREIDYQPFLRASGFAPGWKYGSAEDVKPDPDFYYAKPVIALTGAGRFSAAENFVAIFDAMKRGTLVGEATPGSTGDSVIFKLPGGGTARIMMADVEYPDNSRFEGIGISPQVRIEPTISDIRQKKDAVLEYARHALIKSSSTVDSRSGLAAATLSAVSRSQQRP